ncbi:hypothetical protein [Anoxynatronum sibiricum]|uniref:Uncharacterized protein n=1 Tax=Anoxynatronum sibiricum TaxID=210623 RepID=A0ABU9VV98_9CLOT
MKKKPLDQQQRLCMAATRNRQPIITKRFQFGITLLMILFIGTGCVFLSGEIEKVDDQALAGIPTAWDWWTQQMSPVQARWMSSFGFQAEDSLERKLEKQRHQHSNLFNMGYACMNTREPEAFDRAWFQSDQTYFQQLHSLPDTQGRRVKLYLETHQLQRYQQNVINEMQKRHPHYRLYSPEETDAINSLFIATNARRCLLKDSLSGDLESGWENYYPLEYTYAFFQLEHLNLQGGIEKAAVEIMDLFTAYDEAVIHGFLDGLPAPEMVYDGKEIFFINGANDEYGAVHANGQILVFNLFEDVSDILKLLAHEVGHEVGYLIFGRDGYENQKNSIKETYANLYGYPVPVDERVPWGARLSENFAEDFAWVYGDFPKWSWWEGVEKPLVQNFIETELGRADLNDAVLIRDNIHVYADNHVFTLFSGFHEDHVQIIVDPQIQLVIDGFQKGPYDLFVHVRNNVTGNLPRQPFSHNGVATLSLGQLPEEQHRLETEGYVVYEVQIKLYHYTSLRKYHQPTIARFWVVQWAGW